MLDLPRELQFRAGEAALVNEKNHRSNKICRPLETRDTWPISFALFYPLSQRLNYYEIHNYCGKRKASQLSVFHRYLFVLGESRFLRDCLAPCLSDCSLEKPIPLQAFFERVIESRCYFFFFLFFYSFTSRQPFDLTRRKTG